MQNVIKYLIILSQPNVLRNQQFSLSSIQQIFSFCWLFKIKSNRIHKRENFKDIYVEIEK